MKLPTELRLRIYRYHLEGTKISETEWTGHQRTRKLRVPGILGVSREVRNEAMDVLFQRRTIQVKITEKASMYGTATLKFSIRRLSHHKSLPSSLSETHEIAALCLVR